MDERISRILEEFCAKLQVHLKQETYARETLETLRQEGYELSLMVSLTREEETEANEAVDMESAGDGKPPEGPRKFSREDKSFFEELKINLPIKPDNTSSKD